MGIVLVVDDDKDIREAVRCTLEDAGYSTLEARDGREALGILAASVEPLVVLLDVVMPRLDGISMLRLVVADSSLASRHAYILTSASTDLSATLADREFAAIRLCALAKPFDLDALLRVIDDSALALAPSSPLMSATPSGHLLAH